MSEQIKRRFNVGIGKETERGTVVVPGFELKPTSEDFNDQVETIVSERGMGVIEDSEDLVVGKKFSSGSIAGELFDKSIGLILLGAFGKVDSAAQTAPNASVYDHTFTVLQSAQHPSFTLDVKRGDIEHLAYPNCVIENLKIEAEGGAKYVTFEADFRGKAGVASTTTPSYVAENYFLAKDVIIGLATNYSGIAAATAIDVKSLSLEISKNIEDVDVLGDDEPSDFLNKQIAIEGEIVMNFSSATEKGYVLNNTPKAMRITFENTSVTIGSSAHPKLVIDLAKVKFSEAGISGGNNDLAGIALKFKGLYSATDSKSITAVLSNIETAY